MAIPNAPELHKPEHEYMLELVRRIGKNQTWIAKRAGISLRRIQYLIAGVKLLSGERIEITLSYPEQFVLEALAEAGDVFTGR